MLFTLQNLAHCAVFESPEKVEVQAAWPVTAERAANKTVNRMSSIRDGGRRAVLGTYRCK